MGLATIKKNNDKAFQRYIDLAPCVFVCAVRAQVARDLKSKRTALKWLRVMRAGLKALSEGNDALIVGMKREMKLDKLIRIKQRREG